MVAAAPSISLLITTHCFSTFTFSLGISLLELACELELPSGGANWHLLRQGKLPEEFIKGKLEHCLVYTELFLVKVVTCAI